LGLCRPANEVDQDKIYGVLPYIAPEVLKKKEYTQASDIYSFGIVAYELFANAYPYADANLDDMNLAIAVCKGLRPNLDKVEAPQEIKNLIGKCWDAEPKNRPTVQELEKTLRGWKSEVSTIEEELKLFEERMIRENDTDFCRQYISGMIIEQYSEVKRNCKLFSEIHRQFNGQFKEVKPKDLEKI